MLRVNPPEPAPKGTAPLLLSRGRAVAFLGTAMILMSGWLRPVVASESPAPAQAVRYFLVVTGGELLAGAYADGHTQFITRTLHPLGFQCVGSMCVDDKVTDIQGVLRFARDRAALVIVTGGLGPTDNDITREALSQFTGIPLKEHPDVLAAMAKRFGTTPEGLRSNLRRQTQTPTQGAYLRNPNGTAIGLVFEASDVVVVALPGPPRELQPMVREELTPYLSRRFGTRTPGPSLTLRFVGLGQSEIDQRIKGLTKLPTDVTTSSQFQGGRVDFTFSLPQDTPQGGARLQELRDAIVKHMGDHIYGQGDTSLEQHVMNLLAARGQTLAVVEAGSGGDLVSALGTTDGAARALAGACVAPTDQMLRRLLDVPEELWTDLSSDTRPARLAATAAQKTQCHWVVAVGQAQSDADGAGYVQVAFRRPDGRIEARRIRLRGTGDSAREHLTTQLLDQLRRSLE